MPLEAEPAQAGNEPAPAAVAQAAVQGAEKAPEAKGAGTEAKPVPAAEAAPAPAEAPVEAKWRDDWRETLAKGDDKLLSKLNRFQSVDNVFRSYIDMERKMSAKALPLPEGASDEEVAQFRKNWNIPDKPEGYGIKPPEGFSKPETEDLNAFLADMHAAHVPPNIVHKATESYFRLRQQEEQQLYNAAVDQTIANKAELKAEMGKDYDRHVRIANAELVARIGADKAKALPAIVLADGTLLGDNPDFVRLIVAQGLRNADDAALISADGGQSGKTVQQQIDEIMTLMDGDDTKRRQYHSKETQDRLMQLYQAKMRGNQRAA